MNTTLAERPRYSRLGHAEMGSYFFMAYAAHGHCKSLSGMIGWRHYFKVLDSIVQLVAVFVVDVLVFVKRTTKVLFHNVPMLKALLSIYTNHSVPTRERASTPKRIETFLGTEGPFVFCEFARSFKNVFAALMAGNYARIEFRHRVTPFNVVLGSHWRSSAFGCRHYSVPT